MSYLFRITAKKNNCFAKYKSCPFYVIASNKEEAVGYLKDHLNKDYDIGKVSNLGENLSGIMFIGKKVM